MASDNDSVPHHMGCSSLVPGLEEMTNSANISLLEDDELSACIVAIPPGDPERPRQENKGATWLFILKPLLQLCSNLL